MKKGWKTRIEERRYFEEKMEERQELVMLRRFVQQKMEQDIQMQLHEMRKNHELN